MNDDRQALFEAVGMRMKEVASLSVLYSQTLASRLGINSTDLECLELVSLRSDVTAGVLAERTGLTTGAITTAIDRLERAGFAERQRDEADRRKVVVVATSSLRRRPETPGTSMRKVVSDVLAHYESEQLEFLSQVLGELCEAAKRAIASTHSEKQANRSRKTNKSHRRLGLLRTSR